MVVPLEMGWRHLLFENYPVDPEVMDAHLPDGLDPDSVIEAKDRDGTVGPDDPEDALASAYDVLVEATPTTLGDAQPGFGHV
jgi:hypothetical protein